VLEKDTHVLLERYDKDKDGIITFEDFANEIVTVPMSDALKEEEHWEQR
jgi:Ca2+-binding EF-hand superfamily protein